MARRKKTNKLKAVVLLPLSYNDGMPIPESLLQSIYFEIYTVFDGYTLEGDVVGAFRMSSGEKCVERLTRVGVALVESQSDALRTMAAGWARLLRQEAIYLEFTPSKVEFVPPN